MQYSAICSNKELIEQRSGFTYKEFLNQCITSLEQMDEKTILDGLGELLAEHQKRWVKTKLRSETLFLLRLALSNEK